MRHTRGIRLGVVLGGLTVVALIFLVRAGVGQADSSSNNMNGTFAFRMVPVKSFSSDNASSSGLATAPYQDILRVGFFTATPDILTPAHGSLSGKTIATIDNNSGSTRVVVFNWTGHFGVNGDGTGVFTVEALAPTTTLTCFDSANNAVAPPATTPPFPPPPPSAVLPLGGGQTCDFGLSTSVEGPESYAFVIARRNVEFIETDNGPGGGGAKIFLTGHATSRREED